MNTRKFKKPKRLSILVEEEFHQHLICQTMEMSRIEQSNLSLCEMVRRGLEHAFPTSNQEMLSL